MENNLLSAEIKDKILKDEKVIAVILFGSYGRGEEYRDIDLCIVLNKKYSNIEMSKEALIYTSILSSKFDISIFQQLPLYIRKRVLKEGKILFCKDESLLYKIAFLTIREFNLFEKYYDAYLARIKDG